MPKEKKKKKKPLELSPLSTTVNGGISTTRSQTANTTDDVICSQIYDQLEQSVTPLSSPTICRSMGGIFTIWKVRENLQKLENERIAVKVGPDGWMLIDKCKGTTAKNCHLANHVMSDEDRTKTLSQEIRAVTYFLREHGEESVENIASACGQPRHRTNRLLHFLEAKHVVEEKLNKHWILNREISDEEIYEVSKLNPDLADEDERKEECPCPNAGASCFHVHNHTTINNNNNTYFVYQVGQTNQVF